MVRGWVMVSGLHSSLLITPRMSTMAELVIITSLGPAWMVVLTSSHSGFLKTQSCAYFLLQNSITLAFPMSVFSSGCTL